MGAGSKKASTTKALPTGARRRLAAALAWIGHGGLLDPTDERPAIANALNLDAFALRLEELGRTRPTHGADYERMALALEGALFAPPTPAGVIGAMRIEWDSEGVV